MLNIKIAKVCLNVAAALILPTVISAQQAEARRLRPAHRDCYPNRVGANRCIEEVQES